MIEPEKIRALVVCQPNRLETIAKSMDLPSDEATEIRNQATNLILGKCALCGKQSASGLCDECKGAPGRLLLEWSGVEFLEKLKPATVMLKRVCTECGNPVALSARYLLWRLLRRPNAQPKRLCKACQRRRNEVRRRGPTQTTVVDGNRLMFRPFEGHRGLEELRRQIQAEQHAKNLPTTEKHESFQVKEIWTGKTPVSTNFAPQTMVHSEEHMTDQQATQQPSKKEAKNPFAEMNVPLIAAIFGQMGEAPTAASARQVMEANRPLVSKTIFTVRAVERFPLPTYAKFLNWAEENVVWDKLRLGRDLVLTSVACVTAYKALKWVWGYFKS